MSGWAGCDIDDLPAAFVLGRHGLLLVRGQHIVRLRPLPEALDSVHDVRLLRQHCVSELLRPIELIAHHLQHRGRRCQRFDAGVPALRARPRL